MIESLKSVRKMNSKFNIKRLFWHRAALGSIVGLLVQQMIVASSTVWIARLSGAVATGQPLIMDLVLFMSSLVIVYVPAVVALLYLNQMKFEGLRRYVQAFVTAHHGRTGYLADRPLKEQRFPVLSSEAYLVIDEAARFFFDWLATALNVLLNIAVFGAVIATDFWVAYALSIAVLLVVLKIGKHPVHHAAAVAQQERISLQQVLLRGWENIFIGNDYNFRKWAAVMSQRLGQAQSSALRAAWRTQSISTLVMCASMLPVLGLVTHLFIQRAGNMAALAILVATLPRQILILQHLQVAVSYATEWHGLRARLAGLANALAGLPSSAPFLERVQWHALQMSADGNAICATALPHVLQGINGCRPQRITIRGPNGSGKSTILTALKEHFGARSFLLRTPAELLFEHEADGGVSAGEAMQRTLHEIGQHVTAPLVLLDEWDANLDTDSVEKADGFIARLAQSRCVVEVRHRSGDAICLKKIPADGVQ